MKRDRVDWYLARGLAELEHAPECRAGPGGCSCLQRTDLVIRLKFEPRGRGHEGNEYYLAPKSNVCVVCGAAAGLMRYAVVPQMYRRHLPEQLKSRSSHDIVLLCIKCHQLASVRANELRDALSRECNAPLHPAPQPLDPLRKSARSMAAALLSARAGGIPPARRATMLETVSRFLRQQPFIPASVGGVEARVAIVSGPENISDQVLRWVSSLPAHEGAGPREGGAGERGEACECDDKAALSHGAIVVAAQEDLASFIRRCRKHFLSSMDPVCSRLPSACACACLCMRVHMLLHSTEQGMPYASPPEHSTDSQPHRHTCQQAGASTIPSFIPCPQSVGKHTITRPESCRPPVWTFHVFPPLRHLNTWESPP